MAAGHAGVELRGWGVGGMRVRSLSSTHEGTKALIRDVFSPCGRTEANYAIYLSHARSAMADMVQLSGRYRSFTEIDLTWSDVRVYGKLIAV